MILQDETILFISFVGLGCLFSSIFDVFRAIRRIKTPSNTVVLVQDIIYILIVGLILILVLINKMQDSFRVYLIFSIFLGVVIYMSVIGNIVMNIFTNIFRLSGIIYKFLFITLEPYGKIFEVQIKILRKFVIKCCKRIRYMINFYCSKLMKKYCQKKPRSKGVV